MLFQIVSLLLDIASGLIAGACLLRLYMQMQRIPFSNPVGQLVFALSDWLVIPLRKIVPAAGRWDLSCLVGAFLIKLAQFVLLGLLVGAGFPVLSVLLLSLLGVIRVAATGLMGLIIVNAVFSWVQTHSPISGIVARLCDPILRPIRRFVPLVGGIDFSPLVALVLIQVVMIVLSNLPLYLQG